MRSTRRTFLVASLAIGAVAGGLPAQDPATAPDDAEPPAKLKVLFLGGTGFIGPHIVRALLDHGHEVTLFNRGRRADLFPDLELITGNRIVDEAPGLSPLAAEIDAGRRWDVVVDTSNVHTWTENSAALLKDAATRYVFTSSMSVYADNSVIDQDEDGPLETMPEDEAAKIDRLPYNMQYFGAVKVRCEAAAERHFPGRTTIVRPGLIVGPRDFSHRFTYWPWRVRQGGDVLAPGNPDDPVMIIDVRDLAAFIVKLIEDRTCGIFNLNGPASGDLTIGGLLDACRRATESDATFTWVPADFLAEHEVGPWMDMPVWIPPADGMQGFHRKSIARALAAGLTTRPIDETIVDTLKWLDEEYLPALAERGGSYEPGAGAPGITREREAELLEAWKGAGGPDRSDSE